MKKTFVFYNDRIDYIGEMTLEEKGLFFQTILNYKNGKDLGDIAPIRIIWPKIKKQLDEDNEKRENECKARAEAGRLGGLAKASKGKQKLAKASKAKKNVANLADNDNDNDNDNELNENDLNSTAKAVEGETPFLLECNNGTDSEKMDIAEEKEYGNHEINECLEIIGKYNNGILDGTKGEQRIYSKNLIGKLKKIDSVLAGKFTRQVILEMILGIVSQDQYHSHKISGPKKLYFELSSLMQVARQGFKKEEKNSIGILPGV